ncbi:MAG: hypothetical protein J5517_04790 [Eubacterium sp.]|nr:hypothetical protein [Eubacterium sp.]
MKEVYDENNLDEFEVIETPFRFPRSSSKMDMRNFATNVISIKVLFGDMQDEMEAKATEFLAATMTSKQKNDNAPLPENELEVYDKLGKELMNLVDTNIKKDLDINSYAYKMKKMIYHQMEQIANGDKEILYNDSHTINTTYERVFNDMPLPLEKEVTKLNGEKVKERDIQAHNEFMDKYPFFDLIEDRQDYRDKIQLPYLKAKKNGKVDDKMVKDYINATYEHLQRQKDILGKLKQVPNDEEVRSYIPNIMAYDDWVKGRVGGLRSNAVDRELKALENGWTPDDFELIHNLYQMKCDLDVTKELPEKDKKQITNIYNKFMNTRLGDANDKKKALDSLKPIFKTHEKYAKPDPGIKMEKTIEHFKGSLEMAYKRENPIVMILPDERIRNDMIASLEKMMKGLQAKHRGTLHKDALDSREMTELKDKTREAIKYLKANRDKNIFEDEKFGKIMSDLSAKSNNYTKAKKSVEEKRLRAELIDESLPENSQERRDQERAVVQRLKAWKPKTRMGQTRYAASKDISELCKRFDKNKEYHNKHSIEGTSVVYASMLNEKAERTYDEGVDEILNYYSKKPVFIPEHFENGLYSHENFKATCPAIECKGISNDDFALVAYAAVMDHNNFTDEIVNRHSDSKSPLVTKYDRVSQARTMYTLDISGGTRKNAINHYGVDFIKTSRDKAKEAYDKYRAGDKKPLIDMMAIGISEQIYECMHTGVITGSRRNGYAMGIGLLDRMVEFTKKDPELYDAVMKKLSPETKQDYEDTMNMKKYLDKCIDAEKKLDNAIKNNVELSEAEKKACVKDIIAYDFLTVNHDRFRNEQVNNNKVAQDFKREYGTLAAQIYSGERNDITGDDLIKIDTKYQNESYKPIPQIHGRLRTQEGQKKLNDTIKPLVDAVDINAPVADIRKTMKKFAGNLNESINREKTMQNQAKRLDAANTKNQNPKGLNP